MRTVVPKPYQVYTFDELTDDAKDTAVSRLYDLNVDSDWWECVYSDAADIGLKIESFNGRVGCTGDFTESVGDICGKVLANHGKQCETYKTIQEFYRRRHDGDSMDEKELLGLLLEDYRVMLDREYEYLTSEQAIIDSIECNEYEFTALGHLV